MNAKILAILVIGMLAMVAFTGCVGPTDGGGPTPTPTPGVNTADIPMPEDTDEGEEIPELPF